MTADELLGLYFVDRRSSQGALRIFELRQHLNGVFMVADGDDIQLISQSTLDANSDDLFESYEEALASVRETAAQPEDSHRSDALMQAIEALTEDQHDLLTFIISLDQYGPRAFTGGVLDGRTMDAVSLLDVQIATGLPLRSLVDAIVTFKKMGLLEVVSEPAAEEPHEEEYWLLVHPDAIQTLHAFDQLEDVA